MTTIVYDNNPLDKRLKTAWGFACVIEGLSETILFDTGGEGKLGVQQVAPCHCSDERTRELMENAFREEYINSI